MHSGIASAADIDNCVVVSCAGGGKTTKLIDRLMSLLRRGAAPGEILIITFTNKAAAEIRARLLAELEKAARDDSQMAALRRRILLSAAPADALSVHTFHGWFLTLLRHKPGGFFTPPNVCDSVAAVFEESWRRWQRKAEIAPSAALKTVLRELTPAALRKMCEQFREHRAVYEICTPSPSVFSDPESDSSQDEERMRELRFAAGAFAKCFAGGGKTAADVRAAASRLASGETGPAEEKTYFLTAEDSVRSVLAKHAEKIGCVLQLQNIADALIDFFVREEQRRAKEFNSAALEVCEDFSREWDAVLRARNETTFDDLELRVRKMLEG
ncbi:MAG: UvrD-helicase domain-containing protein, partial [Gammaproteobacteria bacterium]